MSRIATAKVGDFEVVVLKDGGSYCGREYDYDFFPELEQSKINKLLAAAGKKKIETNFHAVLLRAPNRCILVDAGARDFFGPNGGQFPEAMKEAKLKPEEVETLIITHLHPDHIGGTIRKEDNSAVFPNAEFILTEKEYDYWTNDSNFMNVPELKKEWRGIATTVLDAYKDRIKVLKSDAEIVPNVSFIDLPGHTVGHAGIQLESKGKIFAHTADILHAPDLQLADPSISAIVDADSDLAVATRRRIFDTIAMDGILFTGTHFLNCQLGYLEKSGNGYRLAKK